MPGDRASWTCASRRPSRRDRKGYVLVAALLAMVLIGALAVAALFATGEDTKAGTSGVARDLALMTAESAIAMTMTEPTPMLPGSIGVAGTTSNTIQGLGVPVVVYITRLDSTLYLIVAEAVADPSRAGARRRIGVVVNAVFGPEGSIVIDPILERPWSELF
jgi:type II secretory pathway pseudopilin PulG